jgi:hypothetical protein
MKIICTGNPQHIGIANAINQIFPDTVFVSRSNGFDLSTDRGLEKFKDYVKEFDVLINNAYVSQGTQLKILEIVKQQWQTGHVFNIGSLDEYPLYSKVNPRSSAENNKLKELGLTYNSDNFKVTHITVGIFKSSIKPRTLELDVLEPKQIVSAIKWVLEADFDVPVIGIQRMTDRVSELYKDTERK